MCVKFEHLAQVESPILLSPAEASKPSIPELPVPQSWALHCPKMAQKNPPGQTKKYKDNK